MGEERSGKELFLGLRVGQAARQQGTKLVQDESKEIMEVEELRLGGGFCS